MYWIFLSIVVACGAGTVIYFGLQPRAIPKIKPSSFAHSEGLGQAVGERLWQEIKDADVLFLGVEPGRPEHLKVWKSFLETLPVDLKYQQILIDPRLPEKEILKADVEIDLQSEPERFAEGLRVATANKIRIAFILPSIYGSQSIPDNPVHRLKESLHFEPTSISIAEALISKDEEATATYACSTGSGDTIGLGSWGCLIQTKSRSIYRKKWQPEKIMGMMDLIGEKDYLVLIRQIPH